MKMKKTKVKFNVTESNPTEQDQDNIFTNPDFDTFPGTDFLGRYVKIPNEVNPNVKILNVKIPNP
jgi:hypothetical protein